MTKKEWLNDAQYCLNKKANLIIDCNIWLEFLHDYAEKNDGVVFTSRKGKDYYFKEMVSTLQDRVAKLSEVTTKFAELSKGLIRSVPDDMEIREPIGLYD